MSRNASANFSFAPSRLQQAVGAMLDHAPRRQIGQFVIIGRTEQLVLEGLLLADIGGSRKQEVALGDAHRPVRGEQHLPGVAVGDAFLGDRRAAGTKQFEAGFAALAQGLRRRRRRRAAGNPELRRGGVVHQQEIAVLVLNGDAGGQHPEHISQDIQFGFRRGLSARRVTRRSCKSICGAALHGRRL